MLEGSRILVSISMHLLVQLASALNRSATEVVLGMGVLLTGGSSSSGKRIDFHPGPMTQIGTDQPPVTCGFGVLSSWFTGRTSTRYRNWYNDTAYHDAHVLRRQVFIARVGLCRKTVPAPPRLKCPSGVSKP